jgi:Predicted acid phosphatase
LSSGRPLLLVSNDDGPESPGLEALLRALREEPLDVTFIVPEGPRSSSSMSLTFHKPLRAWDREIAGVKGYVVSRQPRGLHHAGTVAPAGQDALRGRIRYKHRR